MVGWIDDNYDAKLMSHLLDLYFSIHLSAHVMLFISIPSFVPSFLPPIPPLPSFPHSFAYWSCMYLLMIPESLRGIARGQFRLYTASPYSRGTAKTQPFPGTNGSFYGIAFVHHTPATVACQHWANVDHASKCNVNFKSWYILGIALGFC